jgi:hypothetical protein
MRHTLRMSRNLLDRNLIVGSVKKRLRRSTFGLKFHEKGSYEMVVDTNKLKK